MSERLRILHAVRSLEPRGGTETYVRDLVALLAARGHANAILYREGEAGGLGPLATAHRLDASAGERSVREVLARVRPDVVLAQDGEDAGLLGALAGSVPTAGYVHIFYPVCPGLAKLLRRGNRICTRAYGPGCVASIYLRRCASARHPASVYRVMAATARRLTVYRALPRVLVASEYMRSLLEQNRIPAERVTVSPPPLSAASLRADADSSPRPGTLLFAGRLEYEKGLDYLLQAMRRLGSNVRLVIAGDGTLRPRWQRLAERLGIAGRVEWRGWLDAGRLSAAYGEAIAVVMPSLMPEPFGRTGVDALGHGRPVVAFDVGGIPEWLEDGRSGYLSPPRDVEALAARLDSLLASPALALEMGRHGRQESRRRFDPARHAEEVSRLLTSLAGEGVVACS